MAQRRTRQVVVLGSLVLLTAVPARGQSVAATFDELRPLIKPGETVFVTDVGGATIKGLLASVSPAAGQLRIQRDSSSPPISLAEREVNNVAVERSDPLWNGMLIGFASGAVPVALLGAAATASGGEVAGVAAGYGVIGLLTGLVVDVLNKEKVTVYVHAPATGSPRLRASPVVSRSAVAIRIVAAF